MPSNFLNEPVYAAKWERTGAEKHYYCLPRSGEKLTILGNKNLTIEGQQIIKEFELPDRTHYFQYYAIIISSSDENFDDGSQIDRDRIFDATSVAIGNWASLEAIVGIQTGIANVCRQIEEQNELIEWRATLAKDLTTLIFDIIDGATGGKGAAPIIGDLIITFINLNKDAFKPEKLDIESLLNAGADYVNLIVKFLRAELNRYDSKLYNSIEKYILSAGQKQEEEIIIEIQNDLKDYLPKKDAFRDKIIELHNSQK